MIHTCIIVTLIACGKLTKIRLPVLFREAAVVPLVLIAIMIMFMQEAAQELKKLQYLIRGTQLMAPLLLNI